METLEELRSRIDSADGLLSVVRTMKGLAAVNIRQYERASASMADYFRTVELGLQVLLRDRPADVRLRSADATDGRCVAVVFGSDQGMVGQFNSEIASHALAELDRLEIGPDRVLLAVGQRLGGDLEGAGHDVADTFSLPSSVAGIPPAVQEALLILQECRQTQDVERVILFHHRPLSAASYEPVTWQILPLDTEWLAELESREWPTKQLPTFPADWSKLLSSMVRQVLLVSLFRAFSASLAAENASRLASMQAAEKNIDERLEKLNGHFHLRRQTAITAELLDVMSGFEALQG